MKIKKIGGQQVVGFTIGKNNQVKAVMKNGSTKVLNSAKLNYILDRGVN